MESRREQTKNILADCFKKLILKGSFDKITVKMITDEAGVIRPTFYNYFQDKYEVIEWLLEQEIFNEAIRLLDEGKEKEAIQSIFVKMDQDRSYYQKVFEVTGQNGFEEILSRNIENFVRTLLNRHSFRIDEHPDLYSETVFIQFQTVTIVSGIKLWMTNKSMSLNADEAMEFYMFLMSHSIMGMINM